ncbi:MAG: transglutaminase domain-containing protein, partial [Bacteroidaceae bacterium]|nr:transglutaminase domain-containing protein [Bacteroidaceae bacterium]
MSKLYLIATILALLTSCNSGKESKASAFLLENNRHYAYTETALVGASGNRIPFSPYQYSTLYGAMDTLETLKVFNTVYSKQYPDSMVVPEAFIREHAARRVKQWKESPHYRNLSWEEFREYWLPYRIETEKFCDYHAALDAKYGHITNALKQGMSVTEATNMLQSDLRKRLVFDLRDHASLNQPSVLETMELGKGGCRGITTLTTLALRNIGIVSAIDECPVWAHRNSGHQWNVVRTESGEWIPFNGAEDSIGGGFPTLNDSVKAPKIYRKQFSRNPDFAPPVSREQTPALFLNACRTDVTSTYQPTVDVTVMPTCEHEDSVLYLAVFNAEVWKIVSWAELKDGKAIFKDMGCNDIVYLPVYYYRHTTLP